MPVPQEFAQDAEKKLKSEKTRIEGELSRFAKPTDKEGDFETQFENIGRDRDDNAHEVEAYGDSLALENALETKLVEIQKALGRIAEGQYGICEKCHTEISLERLQAYPEATLCSKCAQ